MNFLILYMIYHMNFYERSPGYSELSKKLNDTSKNIYENSSIVGVQPQFFTTAKTNKRRKVLKKGRP